MYNDPDVGVEWPITDDMELTFSERDKVWAPFKEQFPDR